VLLVALVGVRDVGVLAQHPGAQRTVADHRGDVARVRLAAEGVEVLLECLPLPLHALVQRRARHVLDRLDEVDQELAPRLGARGEPDAC